MLHTKNKIPTSVRRLVYRRDGFACALCLCEGTIHLHHATPRSRGGSNEPRNLIALCPTCHAIAHGEYRLKNQFPFDQATAQDAIHYYLEYTPDEPP